MKRVFFGLSLGAIACTMALQFPATAIAKGRETVLHSFGNGTDGAAPVAGLVDVKGTLYGTTAYGGAGSANNCQDGALCGTVFAVDASTGAETVLHSFGGSADGTLPYASLIDVKDTLYGTTSYGGAHGDGTVFSLDLGTGTETVLYSFCRHPVHHQCRDGEFPVAGLIDVNGALYGTTDLGGVYQDQIPSSNRVLFVLDPNTGAETVLYAFRSRRDGTNPGASLIDVVGTLYGTTQAGGTHHDRGTVFAFKP